MQAATARIEISSDDVPRGVIRTRVQVGNKDIERAKLASKAAQVVSPPNGNQHQRHANTAVDPGDQNEMQPGRPFQALLPSWVPSVSVQQPMS
eukprot:4145914-Pyramimonas_sp.AAC.1